MLSLFVSVLVQNRVLFIFAVQIEMFLMFELFFPIDEIARCIYSF